MRYRRLVLRALVGSLLLVGAAVAGGGGPASASTPHYYLALGDSLSQGYQSGLGDSDAGYPNVLYGQLHAHDPSLQPVKLGCSGETTTTMLHGGSCPYAGGSQLAAAKSFLLAHPDSVRYLSIDIGANDLIHCAATGGLGLSCLVSTVHTIMANLDAILCVLRSVPGTAPIAAGMSYYDPFLAQWLAGPTGRLVAGLSIRVLSVINAAEGTVFGLHGYGVADVFRYFRTAQFSATTTMPGRGAIPVDVAAVCRWTSMCSTGDIHANVSGYRVIAQAFAAALR